MNHPTMKEIRTINNIERWITFLGCDWWWMQQMRGRIFRSRIRRNKWFAIFIYILFVFLFLLKNLSFSESYSSLQSLQCAFPWICSHGHLPRHNMIKKERKGDKRSKGQNIIAQKYHQIDMFFSNMKMENNCRIKKILRLP